jgi:hypothetical protein
VFGLATGHTSLVRSLPGYEYGNASLDPTGRYLLVAFRPQTAKGDAQLTRLDIATGQVTWLSDSWAKQWMQVAW